MMSIPSEFAGVAGGIFNSSLQLGVVIGLSISTGEPAVRTLGTSELKR
jgi:hypothetical protein